MSASSAVARERLLTRARAGSTDALAQLLERGSPRLHLLIRARMGSLRARQESRDVLQSTLLKALVGFAQFSGPVEALGGWLASIAENEMRDLAQHQRRKRRDVALEQPGLELDQLAARASSMTSRIYVAQRFEQLEEGLLSLTEQHREVILLRYAEELEFAAIGERLGRSADASRMLLARAMTALTLEIERLRGDR